MCHLFRSTFSPLRLPKILTTYYKQLRQYSPVHYFDQHNVWTISQYKDVVEVLKSPEIFSSFETASFEKTLLGADPPQHTHTPSRPIWSKIDKKSESCLP